MESHNSLNGDVVARDQYDEDLFSFTTQLPPLDHLSGSCYVPLNCEYELLTEDSFLDMNIGEENKECKEKRNGSKLIMSKEAISEYFYMPIAEAAKELKVGVTNLKKRCRELGIQRWPCRKLKSLQTLEKNIHELGKDGREVELVDRERKLMEEVPDLQLDDNTKRLRQACFKAIYKKKKACLTSTLVLPNE